MTDKWFPVIEGILPARGFVNGLDFPTSADLCIVTMIMGAEHMHSTQHAASSAHSLTNSFHCFKKH